MKHFLIDIFIVFFIIFFLFWLLPTGFWLIVLLITAGVRVFCYFNEKHKAKIVLAQAEADFLDADAALTAGRQSQSDLRDYNDALALLEKELSQAKQFVSPTVDVERRIATLKASKPSETTYDFSALEEEQKDALKARKQAEKNAGKWSAFTRSNNLDFVLGLIFFLIFLSATISGTYTPEPIPRDLPAVTSFWYRTEKAWLGKDRANQLLREQENRRGESFPPPKGKRWGFFDSWIGVALSFLFLLPLFWWSISDELEKTKKYLFQKDKRESIWKEGDHSGLFYIIAMMAGLHEIVQWFHIEKNEKKVARVEKAERKEQK